MTCFEKYMQDHPNCSLEQFKELLSDLCPSTVGIMDDPEGDCISFGCVKCWLRQIPSTEPSTEPVTSAVDHPKHYRREGGMECIDEMLLIFGVEATMHFCLLNAWKYRYRSADKNGEEDMAKSGWYIAKYAELKGGD